MKINNILEAIGNTPHLKINRLFGDKCQVWSKVESFNPGGSIKDRIGLAMINDAEKKGIINQDTLIVEPTSGNTGIGLAMAAAVKGYKLVLVMPESMSVERRKIMQAYGAKLELTPKEGGMKASIAKAEEIISQNKNSWMPMQFKNEANTEIHRQTTVAEILKDFPDGLDYIITGVGTGGHITACAEVLKSKMPNLKVLAVEPAASTVLSGGTHTPHKIQGIAAGFIPDILNLKALDGFVQVSNEEAFEFAQRAAREEGLLVGISSGAALAAVSKKIKEIPEGSRVLTFSYDTGERYLSTEGLF